MFSIIVCDFYQIPRRLTDMALSNFGKINPQFVFKCLYHILAIF